MPDTIKKLPKTASDRVFRDWRTTAGALLGVGIFLAGHFDIEIVPFHDFGEMIGIFIAGITGLLARDKDSPK